MFLLFHPFGILVGHCAIFYNHDIPSGLIVRPKSRRDVMIMAAKIENQIKSRRDVMIIASKMEKQIKSRRDDIFIGMFLINRQIY